MSIKKTVIIMLVVAYLLTTAFLQVFVTLYNLADAIIGSSAMEPIDFVLWGLFAVCTIVAVRLLARKLRRRRRSKPLRPPQGSPVTQPAPPWLYRVLRLVPRFWFSLLFVICLGSVIGLSLQPPGRGTTHLVLMLVYWMVMWHGFRLVVTELTYRWMGHVWPMACRYYERKSAGVPDGQKQEQWPPPSVNG